MRFGFVINVFSLKGLTLLPEISKDKERTFKEFEGIGEDKSGKAHENDADVVNIVTIREKYAL